MSYVEELRCKLDHSPIRPPRKETLGEQVFAARWKELMQSRLPADIENDRAMGYTYFEFLMEGHREVANQRHASIAASFITWLGTNYGRSILLEAERQIELLKGTVSSEKVWAQVWAWENRRSRGMNHGVRLIEGFCMPSEMSHANENLRNGRIREVPDLSVMDYEVVDCLIEWLSSGIGNRWIKDTWKLIYSIQDKQPHPYDAYRTEQGLA